MKFTGFVIPKQLEEACSILKELGEAATPVAGATCFHFLADDKQVTAVDIRHLGLNKIDMHDNHFYIGATTTIADIAEYRADGWVLHEVARRFSTQQVRNISTVGGNIVRVFPWADFPVALLALDAQIVIHGEQQQVLPAEEYFQSQPLTRFKDGKLLTQVRIPAIFGNTGFGYHKEVCTSLGLSMVTVAAAIDVADDKIHRIRIAAGGALPSPRRLTDVENALIGKPARANELQDVINPQVQKSKWRGKEGMSNEYATQLAQVVINDVVAQALTKGV